jgi:hypothetical protein
MVKEEKAKEKCVNIGSSDSFIPCRYGQVVGAIELN